MHRVLRVIASMDPVTGGPCQGIRNSVPALTLLGWENEVVCLDAAEAEYGVEDPFPIHRKGPGKGPWMYNSRLSLWLKRHLVDFDSVIIHGLWLYNSYAVTKVMAELRRAGAQKLPTVFVMPHGMLDPWFQRTKTRRMKAYRNWVFWKWMEHRVIEEAEAVLFTCQRELELARVPFRPYRPRKEHNVGYGVAAPPPEKQEMHRAFRTSCPGIADKPYLLFLSRIHPKKGVDLLLKAYAAISKEDSGRQLPSLVIAGPLDSAFAREMQNQAKRLGLVTPDGRSEQVHFPGLLSGDNKWGAIYGCDAFILPSHQENFGIAVVEALACGRPALISNQVNISSDLESDGAALVYADHDSGLTGILRDWFDFSLDKRMSMGESAVESYRRRYLPRSAAVRLIEAIS
ncbi:MAG: glycosyltransferase [bacterium]|nr:glycosyltransferase [bacterium]